MDISSYMGHDVSKYIFISGGLLMLFAGFWVLKRFFRSTKKQKKADVHIEYDENDERYYYRRGPEQLYRIYVENTSDRTIKNARVEITDMKPRHPVFSKKFPVLKSFDFHPGKEQVDVIRLLIKNRREMYEFVESKPTMQTYFSVRNHGHEITTTVFGENIAPISRRFHFGIQRIQSKSDRLWFKPVD